MDKKGVSPFFTMITGVQAMVLIVIIMVIFGVIFVFLASQSSITLTKNENFPTEDIRLLNYLKTPVVLPNEKTTLGEFIISTKLNPENKRYLRSEVRKVISSCKTDIPLDDRISLIVDGETYEIGNFNMAGILGSYPRPKRISNINLPGDIQVALFKSPDGSPHINPAPPLLYNHIPIKIIDGENKGVSLIYLTSTAPNGDVVEDCEGKKWVHWSGTSGTNFLNQQLYDFWSEEGYPCETEIVNGKVLCKNFLLKDIFDPPAKFKKADVKILIEKCFMESKLPQGELIFNIDNKLKNINPELVGIHTSNREECIKAKEEFLNKY